MLTTVISSRKAKVQRLRSDNRVAEYCEWSVSIHAHNPVAVLGVGDVEEDLQPVCSEVISQMAMFLWLGLVVLLLLVSDRCWRMSPWVESKNLDGR